MHVRLAHAAAAAVAVAVAVQDWTMGVLALVSRSVLWQDRHQMQPAGGAAVGVAWVIVCWTQAVANTVHEWSPHGPMSRGASPDHLKGIT
jgi:hypothetical protein